MWHKAIETPAAQQAIAGRTIYRQETIRMFGLPESGLAETLRDAQHAVARFSSLEITTCLRRGEIEMVTRYEPEAAPAYAQLTRLLRDRHAAQLYSEDGSRWTTSSRGYCPGAGSRPRSPAPRGWWPPG